MARQAQSDARSLYHRWRSRSFAEVVAQEHVTRTLRNAVATGRIVHAYLFCGPRGTGKTSSARVLAKAVNCLDPQAGEPCNRCGSCVAVSEGRAIDLIEIDAASNRGIDDARELREKIKFSPAESRYKVYIIDEAHMLTSEASNALLKTLEEPPEHAILILATTESHKILPTIASRCQRFDFRRIPLQAIVEQLEMICEHEGLAPAPGVLDRVARLARGSLRDAESLLDQLVAYCGDGIDLVSAREVLGLTGEEAVPEFAESLLRGALAEGFRLIDGAASTGADLRHFSRELVDYLRALMVVKSGADTSLSREFRAEELARLRESAGTWDYQRLLLALRVFGDLEGRMRLEAFNQLHLEMALAEVILATATAGPAVAWASAPPPVAEPAGGSRGGEGMPRALDRKVIEAGAVRTPERESEAEGRSSAPSRVQEPGETSAPLPSAEGGAEASGPGPARGVSEAAEPFRVASRLDLVGLRREWPRVRKELGASGNPATAMILQGCEPLDVEGDLATFGFETDRWRDRVERLGVRRKVEESLGSAFGAKLRVQFKYGVRIDRGAAPGERDAVVEVAERELGFKVLRMERLPD